MGTHKIIWQAQIKVAGGQPGFASRLTMRVSQVSTSVVARLRASTKVAESSAFQSMIKDSDARGRDEERELAMAETISVEPP
jgi:hypothetical protein